MIGLKRQNAAATLLRTFTFWVIALGLMVATSLAARLAPDASFTLLWGMAASACVYVVARWFAKRSSISPANAGLGWSGGSSRRFAIGLAIGIGVYLSTIAVNAALFGPIRFAEVRPDPLAILLVVVGLAATITMEELVFRSYALWNSVGAVGSGSAQVIVAIAFSGLHLVYGWSLMTVLLGVLPSAILFGAAAIASRGLAMPLGVHLGMVFARWVAGEGDRPLLFAMDTSEMNQSAVATYAPYLGAFIPLLVAAIILTRRSRPQGSL